jgi:hypothetical protein
MAEYEADSVAELVHDRFDQIRGRLCGLIESFGLEDKQERACIQTLKTLSYDSEKALIELVDDETSMPRYINGG